LTKNCAIDALNQECGPDCADRFGDGLDLNEIKRNCAQMGQFSGNPKISKFTDTVGDSGVNPPQP
jgi:hypothetical protein